MDTLVKLTEWLSLPTDPNVMMLYIVAGLISTVGFIFLYREGKKERKVYEDQKKSLEEQAKAKTNIKLMRTKIHKHGKKRKGGRS